LLGDPTEFMGTTTRASPSDTRVAVVSDIHANLHALEAVLADIDNCGITRIWCLGDTMGYGAHPVECLRLVRERCELVLAGNHDLAAVGDEPDDLFGHHARRGVVHAQIELERAPDGAELREWVALRLTEVADARRSAGYDLTHERMLDHHRVDGLHRGRIVAAHAAPAPFDSVWDYVGVDVALTELWSAVDARLVLVGHSHHQFVELSPGWNQCIVNPGSVGQPRDGDPRAAWLELDIDVLSIATHRTEYDIAAAAAAIRAVALPAVTAERLHYGE
jgi:predicted phosphodiesterase